MSSTPDRATEERLVRLAMAQASKAIDRGDAPFGAVLADADGRVLAGRATSRSRATTRPRTRRSRCSASRRDGSDA